MRATTFTLAAILLLAGCGTSASTSSQEDSPAASSLNRMNTVPGLARDDASAVTRDEQIAAYQVWLREQRTADCMANAGFGYHPELLYPIDEMRNFNLPDLEKLASASAPDSSAADNAAVRDSLSREDLDHYYRSLLGEKLEDIEYAEESGGRIPPGRGEDFAVGGCYGDALDEIGRLWDFRDRFAEDLEELRVQVRSSDAMTAAAEELETCTQEHGAVGIRDQEDLEAARQDGVISQEQFEEAESTCITTWVETERDLIASAEDAFYERHQDEFSQHTSKTLPLYEQSRADQGFIEAVARSLAGQFP